MDVTVQGKDTRLTFEEGGRSRPARFTTSDKKTQEAIEKSSLFNKMIRLFYEEQSSRQPNPEGAKTGGRGKKAQQPNPKAVKAGSKGKKVQQSNPEVVNEVETTE